MQRAEHFILSNNVAAEKKKKKKKNLFFAKSTKQNEWQSTIHTVQKATGKA